MDAARISRDFLDVNVTLAMNWTGVEATAQVRLVDTPVELPAPVMLSLCPSELSKLERV